MKKKHYHLIIISAVLLLLSFSCTTQVDTDDVAGRTKVALRAVGNEVLLSQGDSTSVVMPVVQISANTYQLSFEHPLSFDPTDLHSALALNIEKAGLPRAYKVEVIQCIDGEVGYSYLLRNEQVLSIIPCGGRLLPQSCYTIHFSFLNGDIAETKNSPLFYLLVSLVLAFLVFVFYSRFHSSKNATEGINATILGSFYFYPDQNKLVKAATEIPLSRKECELLEILVSNANQIVKREDLAKQVWEDQGVIVGRSLDTYISKLRKKLKSDESLKIVNAHGVGYKLEIEPLKRLKRLF